tara:strand:- start:199 stop:507 length:309 start_codon:yes stop_codon:yes gene_type:complete
MNQSRGPVQVGSLVSGVLEQHGVKDQIKRMTVLKLWPEIVGEHVAAVTQARSVSERTLFVEVRTSAWLMELNMMKADFLTEVNRHLEEVPLKRIIFVLGEST